MPEYQLQMLRSGNSACTGGQRPMQVSSSGAPCVAWSPRGAQQGDRHRSAKSWNSYLGERIVSAERKIEDVVFAETATNFRCIASSCAHWREHTIVSTYKSGAKQRKVGQTHGSELLLAHGTNSLWCGLVRKQTKSGRWSSESCVVASRLG